jgi:predicted secreted protein
MASGAVLGYQTLLKRGNGADPETFTTIGEVLDITGPSSSMDTVEVTNQDSPNNYKEYIAGLLDGGEVSFDCNFTNVASQTNVIADHQNRTLRNFQMVLPLAGNPTWSFTGYVTSFDNSQPVQDKITASFSIKITGKPTLA